MAVCCVLGLAQVPSHPSCFVPGTFVPRWSTILHQQAESTPPKVHWGTASTDHSLGFHSWAVVACARNEIIGRLSRGRRLFTEKHVGRGGFAGDRKKRACCSSAGGSGEGEGSESVDFGAQSETQEEARAAVVKVLLEAGLHEEEAGRVVSKSPKFLQELVRTFDELGRDLELLDSGAWKAASSTVQKEEGGVHAVAEESRARLLLQMAGKSKGMYPFLESLGVHLPSVPRVSHSLSSQRLPDLLRKVQYFEELLSMTDHQGRSLDGLMRHMMKNLSLPVDEDLQRTLAFYEKIEARRGLSSLKDTGHALSWLIEAFPQIFLRSLEDEIKPTVALLEELGVSKASLGRVMLCFPPLLLKDPLKELRPRLRNLKKVGVAARDYGRMIVKYPWLFSECVSNNAAETATYLESIKVPKSKIDDIITKCPQLLGFSSTGALVPMIEHLKEFGVKSKRLGRVIALSPHILIQTPHEFDEVVAFLKSFGVESEDVSKLLRRAPEIFASSIEGTLQRKVEFLLELGVRPDKLCRIIKFYPEVLSMSVDNGLRPRMKYLRDRGFSRQELSRMVFKFPPLLGYNPESVLSPKLEFLTQTMKRSIRDVVAYPKFFSFSLEKKIKPRARVLANRQIECDLQTMLGKNDDQFAEEFLGLQRIYLPPLK